jgi:hypothetical protein
MAAPWGCHRQVRQWPSPKLKTSMADPLGVLVVSLAVATTEVEDVDGGPRWGVLAAGPGAPTSKVEDVDGGPHAGCCWYL